MKSKLFGSLVAASVAGMLVSGAAMADAKKKGKKAKADSSKMCTANECKGSVMHDGKAAANECKGNAACAGVTKEECDAGKGTWKGK